MGADILLHALCAGLYLALALYSWRTRWSADRESAQRPLSSVERSALLLPIALHAWLLWQALFAAPTLHFGFGLALSVTLWLGMLVFWVESLFVNLQGMQVFILALAAVSAFLPALFGGAATPHYAQPLAFRTHLVLAMAAYSLFTIGALHALLMAALERHLHRDKAAKGDKRALLHGALAGMPPLLTLEALLFRILALGFVLLTLTLASGIFFSEELFGQPLQFTHKTVFALLSWFIFAALLTGRWLRGWRGRKALRWTLAGFICLLLAYVGSRFVLEVLLGRV